MSWTTLEQRWSLWDAKIPAWLRKVSFITQLILLAYSLPSIPATAIMGQLDYTYDEVTVMLVELFAIACASPILNLILPSRRQPGAYFGYGFLTVVALYGFALLFLYITTGPPSYSH